jgi:hypothetical protein
MKYISRFYTILESRLNGQIPDEDTKTWIADVFLDKVYELEVKMMKIYLDGRLRKKPVNMLGCVERPIVLA